MAQRFGTAEHNRFVDREAMGLVTAAYNGEPYRVRNGSKQNLGWELEARRRGQVVCIEVKGATGPSSPRRYSALSRNGTSLEY